MANITVIVSITDVSTNVTFDVAEFKRKQTPIPMDVLNNTQLEQSFFTSEWAQKVQNPDVSYDMPIFKGPIQAVAASPEYGYSVLQMMDADHLKDKMHAFQQRWLGQMLLAAVDAEDFAFSITSTAEVYTTQRRIVVVMAIGLVLTILLFISALCITVVAYHTRPRIRRLDLYQEPSRIAAATSLITGNPGILSVFEGFDVASTKTISSNLKNTGFSLQHGFLTAHDTDETPAVVVIDDFTPRQTTDLPGIHCSKKDHGGHPSIDVESRPIVLRTWLGGLLLLVVVAVISSLAALYGVSRTNGLFGRSLTYELNFHVGNTVSRLAPYSVIPTLVAVGFKLWYAAVADTLRRQQPFHSMLDQPKLLSQSVLTEYANVPLAVIPFKAFKYGHWLLFIAGLGALSSEFFTVGMSALWTREAITKVLTSTISQQLEVRTVPFVYSMPDYVSVFGYDPTKALVQESVYGTFLTSWLYEAVLELTEQSVSPPWSKDSYSFVPVDIASTKPAASTILGKDDILDATYNVTVHTSALRARLECRQLDIVRNQSSWLTKYQLNETAIDPFYNTSIWDGYHVPTNITIAYEIEAYFTTSRKNNYGQFRHVPMGSGFYVFDCCSNLTANGPGLAAVGYWGPGKDEAISIKWIVGQPLDPLVFDPLISQHPNDSTNVQWLWPQAPQLQALDCTPHIESADATVTLDAATEKVYNYTIDSKFSYVSSAWQDQYVVRSPGSLNRTAGGAYHVVNQTITVSFGQVFLDALLGASNFLSWRTEPSSNVLDQGDHAFSFRTRGLNVDFMSYAMLQLVDNDKTALLDINVMTEKASYVFGTFFKHYAASDVSFEDGGYAFQPIGAKLPSNLSSAINSTQGHVNPNVVDLANTTEVLVHVPVDALVMSPFAVFLCLGILAFLCIVIIVIFVGYRSRLKVMPRDVDTLASALGFVYASDKMLDWAAARAQKHDHNDKADGKKLFAQMGPFEDRSGKKRWGIELVDEIQHEERSWWRASAAHPLLPKKVGGTSSN